MTTSNRPFIAGQASSPESRAALGQQRDTRRQRPWLLTGGAGYIGSHVVRALLDAGERVVVLDDLSTGNSARVPWGVPLVVADVADRDAVQRALRAHDVIGVIHLAAKKSVPDSVAEPLGYYRENLVGLLSLLEAMRAEEVDRLVFSSSAAVYGTPSTDTVDESSPTVPQSPYGRTKLAGEWMVADACAAVDLAAVSLRYFNVVGCAEPALADNGGTNLFPLVLARMAAAEPVTVFGGDCPTPDGTCVRDYIHVADLAVSHVAAARLLDADTAIEPVYNLGSGDGVSVGEIMTTVARVTGIDFTPDIGPRRAGDPDRIVTSGALAARDLDWKMRHSLEEMVRSAWESRQAASVS